ncbi:MAG: hypothetical protein Q7K40_03790 [bacterium]|nr:hypothetical protein [bacterium]
MEQNQNTLVCKSHIFQYIIVIFIAFALGAGLVAFLATSMSTGDRYQEGFDAAKKLVLESTMGDMFRTPEDIRNITGTVLKVDGSRIIVHRQSQNPFDDPALIDRIVLITETTKITKISQGDTEAFRARMDVFMKNIQTGKSAGVTPPTPPELTRTKINISDIAMDDIIVVSATENIKTNKEFSASEIEIL